MKNLNSGSKLSFFTEIKKKNFVCVCWRYTIVNSKNRKKRKKELVWQKFEMKVLKKNNKRMKIF